MTCLMRSGESRVPMGLACCVLCGPYLATAHRGAANRTEPGWGCRRARATTVSACACRVETSRTCLWLSAMWNPINLSNRTECQCGGAAPSPSASPGCGSRPVRVAARRRDRAVSIQKHTFFLCSNHESPQRKESEFTIVRSLRDTSFYTIRWRERRARLS